MKDKQKRPSKKNSKKENKKHPYKKVRKGNKNKNKNKNHGIDCPCNECKKVRHFLKKKEKEGTIYLSGLEEDKKKIRA